MQQSEQQQLSVLERHHVLPLRGLPVQRQGLQLAHRHGHDGATGGLVDAAGLHADETVLHHVDAPDAVLPASFVELREEGGGQDGLSVDGNGNTCDDAKLQIPERIKLNVSLLQA